MATNPYLTRLREQHREARSTVDGLMKVAAGEGRDLTEAEFATVTEMGERASKLADQIEVLEAHEARAAAVAANAPKPEATRANDADANAPPAEQRAEGQAEADDATRAGQPLGARTTSSTTAHDRDPGHYRSVKDGGERSFFGDLYAAGANRDNDAHQRLMEHQRAALSTRALTSTGSASGIVAPKWLMDEFITLPRQGRVVANRVRNIPLGADPRPITLPKQTAGTEDVVAEQAAEGDAWLETDEYDTDVDTVAFKPTTGSQIVTRQSMDMADPAIDQLIFADLAGVYDDKIEAKVCAAIAAAAGAAVTTFGTEALWKADLGDSIVDVATAVRRARKRRADLLAMSIERHARYRKLRDSENRRLVVPSAHSPQNVQGNASHTDDGELEGISIAASDGWAVLTYPDNVYAVSSQDVILWEGNMLRFRFEEVAGPEKIKLGIWAYTGVLVRRQGQSVKKLTITAAA